MADTKVLAEAVVMEFIRSLGYEPREVSELVITPFEATVSGYRRAGGSVALRDGQPIQWSETFQIKWERSE